MYTTQRRVGIVLNESNPFSSSIKKYETMRCTLKIDEYLTMAFCWSCNIFEIIDLLDKIHIHGPVTLMGYALLHIGFVVPVFMLYLFFGKYTNKGFITFWEITPVFKGMAWTIALYAITIELFNVSLASLALLNIKNVLNGSDAWRFCKFAGASDKCWPAHPTSDFKDTCKNNETVSLSAIEYFLPGIKLRYYDVHLSDFTNTNVGWVVSMLFTWCVIYFLMLRGTKEFIKITTPIAKLFWVLLIIPTLIIMLILRDKYSVPATLNTDIFVVFTPDYWSFLFQTCISDAIPGNLILLGSYIPSDAAPTGIAFCIYGLKQLLLITGLVWYTIALWTIKASYKVLNFNCLAVTGLELFFGVIPDTLTAFPFSTLFLILWFFSLWLYGILSTLFTLTAIVTSLIDKKPKLFKKKNAIIGFFCFSCCVFNVALLNPSFNVFSVMFQTTIMNIVPFVIFVIFCIAVGIYTVPVIADDFYFTHRRNLSKYWIHALNSLPLVVIFCIVFQIQDLTQFYLVQQSVNVKTIAYVIMGVLLLPAFLINARVYFNFMKLGKVTMSFKPSASWGPPTSVKKISRLKLNRLEEFYYKSSVECKHNCLLNSDQLQVQIILLTRNKYRLISYLQDEDQNI